MIHSMDSFNLYDKPVRLLMIIIPIFLMSKQRPRKGSMFCLTRAMYELGVGSMVQIQVCLRRKTQSGHGNRALPLGNFLALCAKAIEDTSKK